MNLPFFNEQIHFLQSIATFRSGWLDPVFFVLNYFDSVYFMMVVIPCVWLGISYRWGLRVAILSILSTIVNYHLKHLFDLPRPIVVLPDFPMVPYTDPGFPSGGAQTAALLGGLLIYSWKNPWAWTVGVFYIFLIGFSRLYLGVHYPMDVLGGYCIGFAILFCYIWSIDFIEKFCETQGRGFCILSSIVFCSLYSFFLPSPFGYKMMSALLGFSLGTYLSLRFHLYPIHPRPLWTRVYSALITILVIYVLYFLTPSTAPRLLQSFAIALWISFGATPFCRALLPKR